jgi:hypothetical protein
LFGIAGRTFAVDFLAHTVHPPVLYRSVTTIDVEKGALEEQGATTEQEQSGKTATEAFGGATGKPAGREASTATSPGCLPNPVVILLKWAAVRHGVWLWWW